MTTKTIVFNDNSYLSNNISQLPSHCLLNKGITGCGGTTVELNSQRDSIILCPTKNLVISKQSSDFLGVTGDVSNNSIINYLKYHKGFKKIVATYDALLRLIEIIPNYKEYFLLIDEYHLLFNDYQFRSSAIMYILNNFRMFNDWCFMTATPLKDEFILEELKNVDKIEYVWTNAKPVKITIEDTYFTTKSIIKLINETDDKNLHIFLNSVKTIKELVNKCGLTNYRIICSAQNKEYNKITDPVCKINFYTSCAFEGCDIYDENGLCVIVSDTNISTTVLDISTKVRQICGRLRNSKYKDQVVLILNTSKHRYAGTSENDFMLKVAESELLGKANETVFIEASELGKKSMLRGYDREASATMYVNKYEDKLFFDPNIKYLDIYNYKLISEIYNTSISVLMEAASYFDTEESVKDSVIGLDWIRKELEFNKEYTYQELEDIFIPLFKEHNLFWDHKSSIKTYFPKNIMRRKQKNGKKETYYRFLK